MAIKYNYNFQYHKKQKLIVIWQAKSACTIVNKMYYEQEGLLNEALAYNSWIHFYREKHNKKFRFERKRGIQDLTNRIIHFGVNPYRRAVSSFIHAMRTMYIGKEHENISFGAFINRLISGKIKPDIHHNKQTFYLYKSRYIDYIRMEEIGKKLPIINKKYGLNYKIKNSMHNAPTKKNRNNFIGYSLWNTIKDNIPEKYHNFYNKDIRKKVERLYAEDIKNFGYTWDMFVNNKV